jgi:hypothetical protein
MGEYGGDFEAQKVAASQFVGRSALRPEGG